MPYSLSAGCSRPMKFILLLLVIFSNGHTETAALPNDTEQECDENREKFLGQIRKHNAEEPVKIIYYAMTCSEGKRAPMGRDS